MKLRAILFGMLFFFPLCIFAGVSGTYKVSGYDPYLNKKYKGIVEIKKVGEIYTAHWIFEGGDQDFATGVKNCNSIAFTFNTAGTATYGVQLYQIHNDTLKGPWVNYGDVKKGFEKARKIHQ